MSINKAENESIMIDADSNFARYMTQRVRKYQIWHIVFFQ